MAENVAERALPVGKVEADVFYRVLYPRLGAARPEVLVGPRHGVDAGILDIGAGRVMAVTTDPFFVVPAYGWERAAWFAVHIVASDAATTGLTPSHLSIDLNLPPSITDDDLEQLWLGIDRVCREIGMAIITGHTGRYEGCAFPMLGGATVLAMGRVDEYVTSAMAQPGDAVLITKGVAIETAALLAVSFPDLLLPRLGPGVVDAAQRRFWDLSVVRDARIATSVGVRDHGVTAMHDATERGLFGGLHEIAEASGVGMVVDRDAIGMPPEARAICDLFHINPCETSSEGTLILTCTASYAAEVMARLGDEGIAAYEIGEVVPPEQGIRLRTDGRDEPLPVPAADPFWPAYVAAREGAIP